MDCKLADHSFKIQKCKQKKTKSFYILDDYIIFSTARERIGTDEFKTAMNMRFKIERRFATEVNNHGLRRSRYIGLASTSKYIIMRNLVTNLIRAINIIYCSDNDVEEK